MAVIYLLLVGILALDSLVLVAGRNLYYALRIRLEISGDTNAYLGGFLFIGAVLAMFIHLVASERILTDLGFPRPVFLAVAKIAGVLLIANGILQLVPLALLSVLIGSVRHIALALLPLAAGIGLFVLRARYGDKPTPKRLR